MKLRIVNSQDVKQPIGMQVTFFLSIKLQKYILLANLNHC